MIIKCRRCNGTGLIGKAGKYLTREAPNPVCDAPGWSEYECPDCNGYGEFEDDEPENDYVTEGGQFGMGA